MIYDVTIRCKDGTHEFTDIKASNLGSAIAKAICKMEYSEYQLQDMKIIKYTCYCDQED